MCWKTTRLNSGACTYRRSTCPPHYLLCNKPFHTTFTTRRKSESKTPHTRPTNKRIYDGRESQVCSFLTTPGQRTSEYMIPEKVKPVLFLTTLGIDIYPVGFYAVRISGKHSPKSVGVVSDSVISFFGDSTYGKEKDQYWIRSGFNQGRPSMFFASFGSSRFPWQFKKVEEDAAATPDISYLYTTVGCWIIRRWIKFGRWT
ncbi:hypothetical protein F5051DRAFT_120335 [Lentinula edodes]|nr:hypothetical protein F5051DRAFT_120335 [Lentinula edodes]